MRCGHYVPSLPAAMPVATVAPEPSPPVVRGSTVVTRPPAPKPRPSLDAIGYEDARYATCPGCAAELARLRDSIEADVDHWQREFSVPDLLRFEVPRPEYARLMADMKRARQLRDLIAMDRIAMAREAHLRPDPTTDRTGAAGERNA